MPYHLATPQKTLATSRNSVVGRIAALRGTRNPHVHMYIPVAALRAPCTSSRKQNFLKLPSKLFQSFNKIMQQNFSADVVADLSR